MTTPGGMFQIEVGQNADQFWPGVAGSPDLLLVNNDDTDNITIGPKGVTPGGPNGQLIQPQQSISVPGGQPWSAVTDAADGPVLQVIPGGGNYSPSALAIAGQIAASGLALAIAEEIAAQGLSFVATPKPLYAQGTPSGTAGRVGVTASSVTYGVATDLGALGVFDGYVSRPCNKVTRRYYTEGVLPSAASDPEAIASYGTAGTKVCVTLKPWRDTTGTYGNNAIPGQGGLTYAQHKTALGAAVAYLASVATAGLEITLWHEANDAGKAGNFGTGGGYAAATDAAAAANYAAYWDFYAPEVTSNSVTLVYVPGIFGGGYSTLFFPGASGTGWTLNKYAVDYYASSYLLPLANPRGFTMAASEAQADAAGLPFGVWEWGLTAENTAPTPAAFATWAQAQVIGPLTARLQAGKANADLIWWEHDATGFNTVNANTDPLVIKTIQTAFDTLSSLPVPTISIAGGSSVAFTPISPSPGAGYAPAGGLSYDITINLTAGSGSTVPFAAVTLQWFNVDASGAQPVATQTWWLPMGTAGTAGTVITGAGPQRGQFLQVTVANQDTVTCTASVQMNSTSRSVDHDIWKWDVASSVTVPTYALPVSGPADSKSLGVLHALPVGAGATVNRLMGMCAGTVFIRVNPGTSGKIQFTLSPQPAGAGQWNGATLLNETPSGEFEDEIILPAAPCLFSFSNSDSSSHNVDAAIISLD